MTDITLSTQPVDTTTSAAPIAPNGSWLWIKLMDWCKQKNYHPSTQNELFAIAGEAHVCNAAIAQPVQYQLTNTQLLLILTSIDPDTKRLPPGFEQFARAVEAAHNITKPAIE